MNNKALSLLAYFAITAAILSSALSIYYYSKLEEAQIETEKAYEQLNELNDALLLAKATSDSNHNDLTKILINIINDENYQTNPTLVAKAMKYLNESKLIESDEKVSILKHYQVRVIYHEAREPDAVKIIELLRTNGFANLYISAVDALPKNEFRNEIVVSNNYEVDLSQVLLNTIFTDTFKLDFNIATRRIDLTQKAISIQLKE